MDTTLTTGTEAVEALARALEPHTGPGWLPGTFTTDWVGASQSEAVASGAGRVIAALRADPAAARAVRDAIDPDGLRALVADGIEALSTLVELSYEATQFVLVDGYHFPALEVAIDKARVLLEGTPDAD